MLLKTINLPIEGVMGHLQEFLTAIDDKIRLSGVPDEKFSDNLRCFILSTYDNT